LSRARFTLLYILAWVPLAVLYAVVLASQRGIAVSDALWGAAFSIGIAALLAAAGWWLSTRIRYERAHRVCRAGRRRTAGTSRASGAARPPGRNYDWADDAETAG
jgi:hypothetical protein